MKKLLIVLAVSAAGVVIVSACNKDYDCVCKVNGVETNRYSVRAKTRNAAEDECNTKQSSLGNTYQCYIE